MVELGYALSSEEHPPNRLVANATKAEGAGFTFALISDHYHPWIDRQGHSPFVWSVLGAIAHRTEGLRVGTGVTCPLIRTHPAIVAQASATTACMMPGRFFLGVGTGENLNEHILGDRWPAADERLDMLEEAIEVIRGLWSGEDYTHRGKHYTVEQARIYTLPEEAPPIYMAASGNRATETAARLADGVISTSPDAELVDRFSRKAGEDKPRLGMMHVCWASDEASARETAHEWWPNTSIRGELGQELPLPRHFEQAAKMVSEEDVASQVVCGPDAGRHLDAIRSFTDAGFDHVYVHQIGPDQDGFMDLYSREVIPELKRR